MQSPSFAFTKWYIDCVTADGRAVIVYWASLAWRRAALTWQNVTLYEPGRAPVSRSMLASSPPPEVNGSAIACHMPALGCAVNAEARQRPIAERLFESDAGRVEWCAHAPAAWVSLELRGFAPVRGPGYVECISMSVPPWRLPIRELRWGRWLDRTASRSVVWIDWQGDAPRTWVFVDGIRVPAAILAEEGPSFGDRRVRLAKSRTLHARAFAEVAATIPVLERVVPKSLLALRETKWCSAGTLLDRSATARPGSAIHEVAVFR